MQRVGDQLVASARALREQLIAEQADHGGARHLLCRRSTRRCWTRAFTGCTSRGATGDSRLTCRRSCASASSWPAATWALRGGRACRPTTRSRWARGFPSARRMRCSGAGLPRRLGRGSDHPGDAAGRRLPPGGPGRLLLGEPVLDALPRPGPAARRRCQRHAADAALRRAALGVDDARRLGRHPRTERHGLHTIGFEGA